jgi:hypothetical protein
MAVAQEQGESMSDQPVEEQPTIPFEEALKAANAEIIVLNGVLEQQKEMLGKYIDLSQRLAQGRDNAVKVGQIMMSALQVIAMSPHASLADKLGDNWEQAIASAAITPPPPPPPPDQTAGMEQQGEQTK